MTRRLTPWGHTAMEVGVCDALLAHEGNARAAAIELRISLKQVDNAAERARMRMTAETRVQMLLKWRRWRASRAGTPANRNVHVCATCGGLGFTVSRA